jgi:ABC-type uncharacterized transport system permease subunit
MNFLTDFLADMNLGQALALAATVATGVVLVLSLWRDRA